MIKKLKNEVGLIFNKLEYISIMWNAFHTELKKNNFKALARCISLIENEVAGYREFLAGLSPVQVPVIGITGPPGAGKSTLTDALINRLVTDEKKVGVICVDPSSPFNMGALLGDRIRMSKWYNSPDVFIRSLATRGSLGGLHPKIIEISDLMKYAGFDYIIVETVGVGQSEVEIAGLADVTLVTIVPEAGDEIQTMKAGLMEIADIFVVNKADRPGADQFVKNLKLMLAPAFLNHTEEVPVIKTVATTDDGIQELNDAIQRCLLNYHSNDKKYWLLAEKAYYLIQQYRMKGIDKQELKEKLEAEGPGINLYQFIGDYTSP